MVGNKGRGGRPLRIFVDSECSSNTGKLEVERFNAYNTKENGMQVLIAFLEGNKDQIAAFQESANENKPEDANI